MFFLIPFVIAKNYCVAKNSTKCKNACPLFEGQFDKIYSNLNIDNHISSIDGSIHDIYVADNVTFAQTSHRIHICDPSIRLIYDKSWSKITLSDDIKIDSSIINTSIPIIFKANTNFSLEIDTAKNSLYWTPIIVEAVNENIFITPIFLTSDIQKNIVSISSDSYDINIFDITENVKKIFFDTSKLNELPKTYYCISDKKNKCEQYSSKNLTFINSPSEITNFPIVLIVDTSHPQFITADYTENYLHIIGLQGSDIYLIIQNQNIIMIFI